MSKAAMKQILFTLIVCISVMLFFNVKVWGQSTIENTGDEDNWYLKRCGYSSYRSIASPFTTPSGSNIRITKVEVKPYSYSSNFKVYVRIETATGGSPNNPSNTIVTNGTSNSVACSSAGWVECTYDSGSQPILSPSTTYFLVVAGTSDSSTDYLSFNTNDNLGDVSRWSTTTNCGSETWGDMDSYGYGDIVYRITYEIVQPECTFHNTGSSSQLAFNNSFINDNTPTFRASGTHTGSFNRFQIEINTASNFSETAYTQTFSSTYSSGTQYDLECNSLSSSLPTIDGVTYYVRVRASDDSGSTWGSWSTQTYSFTYKSSGDVDWFQTEDAQFETCAEFENLDDYGNTGTPSSNGAYGWNGYMIFIPITVTNGGALSKLNANLYNADGNIRMALYDNSYDLLAETGIVAAQEGLNQLTPSSSPTITTGTYYLAIQLSDYWTYIQELSSGSTDTYYSYSWNNFPDPLTSSGSSDGRELAMYITVIEDATTTSPSIQYASFNGASGWDELTWTSSGTGTVEVGVYSDASCSTEIIAPTSTSPIDLSSLNTTTYPTLYLQATLTGASPSLNDWTVTCNYSQPLISVGSITAFSDQCTNTTSAEKSYNVSGSNLTADIVITPPANFEISTTSGSGFVASPSTITLTQLSGTVNSTPIYVRFKPTAVQAYSGNITHTSTSATQKDVAVSGNGVNSSPTVTAGTAGSITSTSATISGNTISALGCTSVTAYGVEYSTSNGFATGTGTQVAGSGFSGSAGGTFSASLSSLNPNTTYYFHAYATNGGGTSYTSQGSFATLCSTPTTQASNVTFSSVTSTGMTINWSRGGTPGDGVIVLIHSGSAVDANPVNGTSYTANTTFGNGTQIGTGNYVVFLASGTSVSITGLSPNTAYYYKVYEKNCSGTGSVFNATTPAEGNQTTLCADPTTSPSGVNFTSVTANSMTVNWTRGGTPGDGVIVVAKAGSTPLDPTDGVTYNADAAFGSGTQIGTGNFVVYMGSGTSVNVTNLSDNTTYYFEVFEKNCSDLGFMVRTTSPASGNRTTPCVPSSIPYFEGFESGYTYNTNIGLSGSNVCLSQQSDAGGYAWQSHDGGGYPAAYAGVWNANLYHSNTDWIFIPVSLTEDAIYSISLYIKVGNTGSFEVKYGTSPSSSGMTSIIASTNLTNSYAEYSGVFSPSATGTYYIGIKGSPVSSGYISLDNISIVEIACPYPSTLTSSSITTTTATIGWTAPGVAPAQGYEYYYSTSNTAPDAGTTPSGSVAAGVTTANLSSLSPSTNYFFWVRSKCSASDVSDWVGAATFSTQCGAATIPFFEGFEYGFTHDANVAGCYTQQDFAGSYQIRANNAGGYPYAGSWNANLYHDNSDWLFFRVALTAGANYGFSVFAERGAASNITVKYGTTGSSAGMTSGTIINTTAITDTYTEYTGTISPSSTGTYYIGIYLQMPNSSGYTSIDNISIVQLPDTDSKAEEPASQIAATTISSVNNISAGTAKEVFSFKISDLGTSDGLPTKVTNIRIQPGSSNNADWTDYLQGIKLYDNTGAAWVTTGAPVITDTYIDIPIASGNLDIANGTNKSLSLFAYINSTNLIDGKILDFKIDYDNHGFTANSSFSGFATTFGSADIEGNNITVEVVATEMRFITGQPGNGVPLSADFAVGVRATDANGNRDLGYTTGTVTLSKNSGLGTLSAVSGLTKGFTAGQALWTDVQINQAQTCPADNFTIKADHSGALTDIITSCIVVADAPGNFSITTANGNGCAGGNISVVWTASSGADTYDLYWCNTSGCDPVDGANIITNVTSPYSFTIPSNNSEYRIIILSNNVASSTWSTNTLVYGTYSGSTWTGATSNNWNTASNWCGGAVPDCEDDVIILNGAANYPVLTANSSVRNLSVVAGATLGLGSYSLSIFGDLDLADNTLAAGTGTIECANTGCAAAPGLHYLNLGSNTLNNLTLSSGDVTLVNNDLKLSGNLTINDGKLKANGYDIEIAGNWTNYSLFVPGSGTVTFNGSGNSTIVKNGPEVVVYQTGFEDSQGATAGWNLGSVPGKTEWRRQTGVVGGQRLASAEGSYDLNLYSILNSKPGYAYDGTMNNNSYIDAQKKIDLTDVSSADITFKWYCHGSGTDEFTGVFLANGVEVDDALYTTSTPSVWETDTYSLDAYCNEEAQLTFRMFLIKYSTLAFPSSAGNYGFAIDDVVITGTESAESFNNLVINKSGASVLLDNVSNSKLNVLSDLEIAGGTLNAQGNRLRLYGDFTNNGTFTHGNCEVIAVGDADQNFSGSSDINLYDLTVNSVGDLIIGDNATAGLDVNVAGTFTWKDNNNNIVVGNGTQAKLLLPGDLTIFNGCGIETADASVISIAGHYVNYGVLIPNNGKVKFHGNTDSYIIKEPSEILFSEGFESNDGGFTLETGSDSWARTSGSAHNSNYDLAIKADAQQVPYDYLYSDADDVSATKTIDLTGYTTAELQFWWRCAGQTGDDYGEVYINGNLLMGNMHGKTAYVISPRFDISQYANGPVTLEFRWQDDGSGGNSPGLCIDDIIITGTSINMETFYDLEVDKSNSKSAILRCPIDVDNDMIIVNGNFNCSGLDFPVGRNWFNQNSSDFVHGNNTVTFDGNQASKNQIISSNSLNKFYNVDVDNTGGNISLTTNRMYIENDLNIDAGNIDADSQDIMIEGDWTNANGTFDASNRTVYFRGALDQQLISDGDAFYNLSLPAVNIPNAGNPVKENRVILNDDIRINNDFTLSAGSLDVDNLYDIDIKGDWFNDGGSFIHPNNETTLVKFSGTSTQTANLKADGATVNNANFSYDNVEIDGTDVKFYVDSASFLLLLRNIVINDGKTFKIIKP